MLMPTFRSMIVTSIPAKLISLNFFRKVRTNRSRKNTFCMGTDDSVDIPSDLVQCTRSQRGCPWWPLLRLFEAKGR